MDTKNIINNDVIMWLDLSLDERLTVLSNIGKQTNLSPYAIEKDWWVTMALRALFLCDCANDMVFKGLCVSIHKPFYVQHSIM